MGVIWFFGWWKRVNIFSSSGCVIKFNSFIFFSSWWNSQQRKRSRIVYFFRPLTNLTNIFFDHFLPSRNFLFFFLLFFLFRQLRSFPRLFGFFTFPYPALSPATLRKNFSFVVLSAVRSQFTRLVGEKYVTSFFFALCRFFSTPLCPPPPPPFVNATIECLRLKNTFLCLVEGEGEKKKREKKVEANNTHMVGEHTPL